MIRELFDVVEVLVEARQHVFIEVLAFLLKLGAGKVAEVVVGFADQLFRVQKCVDQKSSAANDTRNPAVAAQTFLTVGQLRSLKSADTAPVTDPQQLNPGQESFNHRAAKVVRDNQIRINLVQSSDERLKHLLLVVEDHDGGTGLLRLLMSVERQWNSVQLTKHGKCLEAVFFGGTVLVNFILDDARDHSDLCGVVLTAGHLAGESQTGQWG